MGSLFAVEMSYSWEKLFVRRSLLNAYEIPVWASHEIRAVENRVVISAGIRRNRPTTDRLTFASLL